MNISLLRNSALVHTHKQTSWSTHTNKQEVSSLLETTIVAAASRAVLQSRQPYETGRSYGLDGQVDRRGRLPSRSRISGSFFSAASRVANGRSTLNFIMPA
jgi:hypothetical protein